MISFHLTGALSHNSPQPRGDKSLGGYVSQSKIVNGALNSLFGDITQYSKQGPQDNYSLIALKNGTGSIINNMVISVDQSLVDISDISISIVIPAIDQSGNPVFERISTRQDVPMYASFASQPVSVPPLLPDAVIGVWIKRSIKSSAYLPKTPDILSQEFNSGQTSGKIDEISLVVSY